MACIMNRKPHYRLVLAAALATLVLRAAIPAGFMPSAAGDGLPFEMCPSAVPAEILAAMSGAGHRHAGHDTDSDSSHFDAGHCPIGQALSITIAADEPAPADIAPAVATFNAYIPVALHSCEQPTRRSRDPPA